MGRFNKQFGLSIWILFFLIVIIVGGSVYYFAKGDKNTTTPESQNTSQNKSVTTQQYQFDIEIMYGQIKDGMNLAEVQALAGNTMGDCGQTDSIPPSVFCIWQDGSKSVSVSFGQSNSVVSKNKTGF